MALESILVTGGAGFIGSNFLHMLCEDHPGLRIVNLDALTYAGNLANLTAIEDRIQFVHGDVRSADDARTALEAAGEGATMGVVHMAAESHVDRSILDGESFVTTNVVGTQVLLDACRAHGVARFVHVSTDEVYGSLGEEGFFTEQTPLAPNSPYSASKAGSDLLVRAAFHTHGFPACITRCSNNYGPYQFPEKLLPLIIANAQEDRDLPIYGDGMYVRDWLYVRDHCEAVWAVLERGGAGEVYNIGGNNELANLVLVRRVLAELGKPESLITFVEDRPGHDRRYAIDAGKIGRELGWKPRYTFERALPLTIRWYQSQVEWLQSVRSGEYRHYYRRQYGR
ncbi:MAG: dTDP-glucose 4,6-dehydratase [Planctomycetota bacterium]|jgi:dTDP-glucose 4,6-dehydratase|nr:dTDP-glucose 4,6-dehydratase [Planctomycetota bacterium]MDP6763699.1 dTDP-glucose 4,6-dehydratase [Planctomycetota bacterium]MDP6990135.1 dTDP-glucose 4,6-dehydratase [Planctomycetota bacterium]